MARLDKSKQTANKDPFLPPQFLGTFCTPTFVKQSGIQPKKRNWDSQHKSDTFSPKIHSPKNISPPYKVFFCDSRDESKPLFPSFSIYCYARRCSSTIPLRFLRDTPSTSLDPPGKESSGTLLRRSGKFSRPFHEGVFC